MLRILSSLRHGSNESVQELLKFIRVDEAKSITTIDDWLNIQDATMEGGYPVYSRSTIDTNIRSLDDSPRESLVLSDRTADYATALNSLSSMTRHSSSANRARMPEINRECSGVLELRQFVDLFFHHTESEILVVSKDRSDYFFHTLLKHVSDIDDVCIEDLIERYNGAEECSQFVEVCTIAAIGALYQRKSTERHLQEMSMSEYYYSISKRLLEEKTPHPAQNRFLENA